jgi:hypothetical protein
MSAPTSIKLANPNFLDAKVRRRYFVSYLLQIWVSAVPFFLTLAWWFVPAAWESFPAARDLWPMPTWIHAALTPFAFLAAFYGTLLWSLAVARVRLGYLKLRCRPREGVFFRDIRDRDYRYWNLRNYARLFPSWLAASVPWAWGKAFFAMRALGATVGKGCVVWDCWVSQEFIEIGDNVKIGQGSCVLSWWLEGEHMVVKKVVLGDNVVVGPRVTLMPGNVVGANTIVSASSVSRPFLELEPDSVYGGIDMHKIRDLDPDEL